VKCALVILWGFGYGTIPVAWNAWITRVAHDEVESGGGLLVATIQLGISAGAAAGGIASNHGGASSAFVTSALILGTAVVVILLDIRASSEAVHSG
jgi:predicted MFS family arabinose efflux permease